MTTDNTIFKLADGYILLEDLESWYSNGLVTPNDRIRVYEEDGRRMGEYKISALIKAYGEGFPFRRVPRPYVSDPLNAYSSDEESSSDSGQSRPDSPYDLTSPKTMGGAFGTQRPLEPLKPVEPVEPISPVRQAPPKTMGGAFGAQRPVPAPNPRPSSPPGPSHVQPQKQTFEYCDYPLYNVANEPGVDLITGQEVFAEMEKLKEMLPLKNWSGREGTYFYFINRQNHEADRVSVVAICRLCNHTPFGGKLFFQHLFTYSHVKALSNHMVSKESFLFWRNHIERCKGITVEAKPTTAQQTGTVPLTRQLYSFDSFFTKIPLFSSGDSTEKLKLSVPEVAVLIGLLSKTHPNAWRSDDNYFAVLLNSLSRPRFCDLCLDNTPKKTLKFVKHIISEQHLTALTGVTHNEYNFWVNLLTLMANVELRDSDRQRITKQKNTPQIPLIDFQLESLLVEKQHRQQKLNELREILKTVDKKSLTENQCLQYQGIACFACELPKNCFKNRMEMVEHVFSARHLNYLVDFGFSEKSCLWWKKIFNCDVTTISKPIVVASVVTKVTPSGNIPRVPLLDLPENGAEKSGQKLFVLRIRDMVTSLERTGKEEAEKKIVNWKCAYCPHSAILTTELEAFNHIKSQKHLEKMKFNAPIKDLDYWRNWAKTTGQPVGEQPIGVQPKPAVIPSNVPRVAMLDQIPKNVAVKQSQSLIYTRLKRHSERLSNCKLELDKARAMNVDWKCTYCKENRNPVQIPNMLYAFNHIMSSRHWKNMNYTASIEDLDFWANWVTSITGDVEKKSVEKVLPRVIKSNDPRVPLLDEMDKNEEAVSKERFNEVLDECVKIFKSGGKLMNEAKNNRLDVMCNICSTEKKQTKPSNELDVFLHVTKDKHREKMGFQTSESDLQYWMRWVTELKKKVGRQSKENSPAPLTNNPRIPLLDVPRNTSSNLSKSEFISRFSTIQSKFAYCMSSKETNQRVSCRCYHCPDSPQMTTIYDVMDHVFTEVHKIKISFQGTSADFAYFEQLLETMPVIEIQAPAEKEYKAQGASVPVTKTPPVQVVNPLQIPAPSPTVCSIPLFKTPSLTWLSMEVKCVGPTNVQFEFLKNTKIVMAEGSKNKLDLSRCDTCDVSMSGWSTLQCALHAFSVRHLYQYQKSGGQVKNSDFDWWIQMISGLSHLNVPLSTKLTPFRMGGYVTKFFDFEAFVKLSSEQQEMLSNVDEKKLNRHGEQLMLKYGGCIYCYVWLLKPIDIIQHYLSNNHLNIVKEDRMVRKSEVDQLMNYVIACQKEKCAIM